MEQLVERQSKEVEEKAKEKCMAKNQVEWEEEEEYRDSNRS